MVRLLQLPSFSGSISINLGVRLVLAAAISIFISSMPQNGLPTTYDLYNGVLALIPYVVLLLENPAAAEAEASGSAQTTGTAYTGPLIPVSTLPTVTCPKCGKVVPFGNFCDLCGAALRPQSSPDTA